MRYILQPKAVSVLSWLIRKDPEPKLLPVFPDDSETRLVVAHLLNGKCYAEVVTDDKHLLSICGKGFPFGRMFFYVKHVDLAGVCDTLPPPAIGERP
jgi:hypothetical protein